MKQNTPNTKDTADYTAIALVTIAPLIIGGILGFVIGQAIEHYITKRIAQITSMTAVIISTLTVLVEKRIFDSADRKEAPRKQDMMFSFILSTIIAWLVLLCFTLLMWRRNPALLTTLSASGIIATVISLVAIAKTKSLK